jgi:glutamate synthase (ferredoxin)
LVDTYFKWTPTRIGGIKLDVVAEEVRIRHRKGFTGQEGRVKDLDAGGDHQWRKDGELHLYNPETIHTLQHATRTGDYNLFKKYSDMLNEQDRNLYTIRGLLDLKLDNAIPIEEVEPIMVPFHKKHTKHLPSR